MFSKRFYQNKAKTFTAKLRMFRAREIKLFVDFFLFLVLFTAFDLYIHKWDWLCDNSTVIFAYVCVFICQCSFHWKRLPHTNWCGKNLPWNVVKTCHIISLYIRIRQDFFFEKYKFVAAKKNDTFRYKFLFAFVCLAKNRVKVSHSLPEFPKKLMSKTIPKKSQRKMMMMI